MALVKCKECGAEISTSAKACPQCGKRRAVSLTKGCGLAVLGLLSLLVTAAILGNQKTSSSNSDAQQASTPQGTVSQAAATDNQQASDSSENPDPSSILDNKSFLKSNPKYPEAIRELIVGAGYECPALAQLWAKGDSPFGQKLEALCGPNDHSRDAYPKLHYSVYPEKLKVDVCKEFTAFGGGCD